MFSVKVVDLSTTYQMPFSACRSDVWFSRSEGGRKGPPAQNRTFQSPPGIGLTHERKRLGSIRKVSTASGHAQEAGQHTAQNISVDIYPTCLFRNVFYLS